MGEAMWEDKCPCCGGKGKLQTQSSGRVKKSDVQVAPPTPCQNCNGTGVIMVVKMLKKRIKDNE